MNGQRILVTGGTGFVGSHLVRRLLNDGARVAVLTRYRASAVHPRLEDIWGDVEILEADLRDPLSLRCVHRFKPATVFHLGAYNHVGQSWERFEECYDVNAKGTANLLDAVYPSTRFVYMSTSEVYGYQTETPWVETMLPQPESPYGVTKYAGELHCAMEQRRRGENHNISIVRGFNVYGPDQSEKAVIPRIIMRCLRGEDFANNPGKQKREFTYVADTVDALLRAAKTNYTGPCNVAVGCNISIRELIEKIIGLTKSTSAVEWSRPYRDNEIWDLRGDNTRAWEVLGWKPEMPFDVGLAKTVKWFEDNVL